MGEVPDITIPPDLLPEDGRFGSGPSKVRPAAVRALAEAAGAYLGTSHRQPAVHSVVARLRDGLASLFSLPAGYEVLLGVGGATAFWDAALFSLIENRSQHLVFGEFSSKFARAVEAAPHLQAPQLIASEPGTHPEPEPSDVDLYALTHNETSTGVAMPVRRPAGAAGLVAVDATSAAGGLRVDPAEFDVYYFSPQKAFGADGGLWLALFSPAAVARVAEVAASGRHIPSFLSLQIALENSRKDQTYNTPSLATLFLLVHQVEWMLAEGGLEWAAARSDTNAGILYAWAEASSFAAPFVTRPAQRSPVTATIDLQGVEALTVAAVLRRNGIVDTEPYRKLGRNQLRIGLWPAVEPGDVTALTAAIDYVVERL